jgi:hypothetical protein
MIKTPTILFCLLLVSASVFSQRTIKGKVVNTASGTPVAGSSVFISGTSVGTTSDQSGFFELNNVPAGRHELVVSSIGYETNVLSFTSEQLPLQLRVEMTVKVKELENVVVEPFVEETWEKWGKTFTESFIGLVPNAKSCKIRNEKAIRFRYYKKSNRLVAYSDEPLSIQNNALGYTIRYQLEDFELNFRTGSLFFAGYPFFEEINRDRRRLQRRWKEARDKAYYGSMIHFIRCVYKDSLIQNGYEVRRMVRVPNLERERVKKIIAASFPDTTRGNVLGPVIISNSSDSMAYYRRIMQQKDYTEVYGRDLLSADSFSVKAEIGYRTLYFPDYLYVTYKDEMEDREYLIIKNEARKTTYQRSYLRLPNMVPVSIDVNGIIYPPQEIFSSDYWGWSERIADMLPSEYMP